MRLKNFLIEDIFDEINIAISLDKQYLNKGKIPFVGRSSSNNALQCYVEAPENYLTKGNCITIGMVGTFKAFWQPETFVASQNILVLRNKKLNKYSALYICSVLNLTVKEKFSYNRPIQKNKFIKEIIKLPEKNNMPDFDYMENHIKKIYNKQLSLIETKNKNLEIPTLNTEKWKEYKLSNLFNVSVSKDDNLQNSNLGETLYIASSAENNGVTGHVDSKASQKSNTMTIARNGSVGSVFYQPIPYCASPDDIRILTPKFKLNVYIALFLKTVIEKEKFKYAYGRKLGTKRIENLVIKLPYKDEKNPDFQYMENYIKSLPYADLI